VNHSNAFSGTCDPVTVTVHFQSEITGGSAPFAFSWDFGDGGTSADASPAHTYTRFVNYTVSLQVTDTSGDAVTGSESIWPTPHPCPIRVPSFDPYVLAGFTVSAIVGISVLALLAARRRHGPR